MDPELLSLGFEPQIGTPQSPQNSKHCAATKAVSQTFLCCLHHEIFARLAHGASGDGDGGEGGRGGG